MFYLIQIWSSERQARRVYLTFCCGGTEALEVDELSALVTREALIGVALASAVERQ